MSEQPNRQNVERLAEACERIFALEPTADVYNVLVNLLGFTLQQSENPGAMLMQTIMALATLSGIPIETVNMEDQHVGSDDTIN